MSTLDLLEAPAFPHGSPDGYRQGCKGSVCPALLSCRDVYARYQGDYSFRRMVDAGTPVGVILEQQEAERVAAIAAERAAAKVRPPKVERVRRSGAVHGTRYGYRAGCRDGCPAVPSCRDAQAAYQRDLNQRKNPDRAPRPVKVETPPDLSRVGALARELAALGIDITDETPREKPAVEHGTLTMHRRGCRDESCPATPSCSDVAQEFYANRNRTMRREVKGHGTNACWTRGCRCAECHAGHRAYYREYMARRQGQITAQQHGTAYGYQLGCRGTDCTSSPSCVEVQRAADRERNRAQGAQPVEPRTETGPVVEHIRALMAGGVTGQQVALLSGVSWSVVKTLLYGKARGGVSRPQRFVGVAAADRILAVPTVGAAVVEGRTNG